jgi:hypothetical protein
MEFLISIVALFLVPRFYLGTKLEGSAFFQESLEYHWMCQEEL